MLLTNTEDDYEVTREGEDTVLRIDCQKAGIRPNIEDYEKSMSYVIGRLIENSSVTKIVFSERRDYEYDSYQTTMLTEIARLYADLKRRTDFYAASNLAEQTYYSSYLQGIYAELKNMLSNRLKADPLGTYVDLKRIIRHEEINLQKSIDQDFNNHIRRYISVLRFILGQLERSRLITVAKPYMAGMRVGQREPYRRIFTPNVKPDFMFTKLMSSYPPEAEELANYTIEDDTEVTIFKLPNSVQYLYHIIPPEFKLDEERYELLDSARNILAQHKPKRSEFVDPERMRQVFYNVGHDLLEELAAMKKIMLRNKELDMLTRILVRYTVGFGLIEVLLQDEKIQDISINSPMGQMPMYIVHEDFDDCTTNIIPLHNDAESWATKLRMISGRPLDEANLILDTELELPGARTRVAAITEPFNPRGLAFSFRRHRDRPWTLPLFIKYRMLTPLAAGLISFIVDGTKTMLIAGTRSSGKSSLLSSVMIEIMRRYRIITLEDTLELPVSSMRRLGFNVQPLKVASALAQATSEIDASSGIRATLRLGDSSLIIGEVRSKEAIALYEAMRVGAAANVVAGTIHGDSPFGVFDRVVNDIGVPRTSFKATDIIIVANPIRSADGLHRYRRVTQITEVGKEWREDPLREHGFIDLMKYNPKTDMLEPADGLINGESDVLKSIAGNVKELTGNWDAVWQNIMLRAKIKEDIVAASDRLKNKELLEANFVIRCNDLFHVISERVKEETSTLDPERIYRDWKLWFEKELRRMALKG